MKHKDFWLEALDKYHKRLDSLLLEAIPAEVSVIEPDGRQTIYYVREGVQNLVERVKYLQTALQNVPELCDPYKCNIPMAYAADLDQYIELVMRGEVRFKEESPDDRFTRKLDEACSKIAAWPEWKKQALEGLK